MSGSIQLGDNYLIEEDGNGDLVITDSNSSKAVATWDDSADAWDWGNQTLDNIGSLSTDVLAISDDIHVAKDSADLQNLIADNKRILLLPIEYSIDSINSACIIEGLYPFRTTNSTGCRLSPDTASQITISSRATVKDVQFTSDVDVTADFGTSFDDCVFGGTVTLQSTERASITGCGEGSITLDSNTANCTVVGCTNVSITDNGTGNATVGNT